MRERLAGLEDEVKTVGVSHRGGKVPGAEWGGVACGQEVRVWAKETIGPLRRFG